MMKYNNREVGNFQLDIELGDNYKNGNFKGNQKYVWETLKDNNITGWYSVEAVMDDLVIVEPKVNSLETINKLFIQVKSLFSKVGIGVYYDDFKGYDYNEETFDDCLDVRLLSH